VNIILENPPHTHLPGFQEIDSKYSKYYSLLMLGSSTVVEIRVRNWLAIFLKIGHFIGYWLPFHWKCTIKLVAKNGFWSAKCCEIGCQWPTVISSTGSSHVRFAPEIQ